MLWTNVFPSLLVFRLVAQFDACCIYPFFYCCHARVLEQDQLILVIDVRTKQWRTCLLENGASRARLQVIMEAHRQTRAPRTRRRCQHRLSRRNVVRRKTKIRTILRRRIIIQHENLAPHNGNKQMMRTALVIY